MQLSSDKSLLAESKVLILYILYKANKPLTNEEFLKLVLSVTDMNYFYFQQFLLDLLNTKYVISYKKEDLDFYEITEQGIAALELTIDFNMGEHRRSPIFFYLFFKDYGGQWPPLHIINLFLYLTYFILGGQRRPPLHSWILD